MTDSKYEAEFAISRLIRYNGKRRNFFDSLHKLSLLVCSVMGSSAFVTIIAGRPSLAAYLTAILAIVSALDNVVGFAERARKHSEQRSRYYDLYCEIIGDGQVTFRENYFKEKRMQIDRDSPPPRKILDVIARNEEDISRGFPYPETIYIAWWRRALRHFIDLPPTQWKKVADVKGAKKLPEVIPEEL